MQKIQIIGNVCKDAVLRETNGRKAINFNIAVNESYKDAQGQKHERTMFYSCTQWREANASTALTQYLLKGAKVFVEGKPDAALYKDNSNNTKIDLRINVSHIEIVAFAKKDEETAQAETTSTAATAAMADDDLPF